MRKSGTSSSQLEQQESETHAKQCKITEQREEKEKEKAA